MDEVDTTLLKCPFCAQEATVIEHTTENYHNGYVHKKFHVECRSCHCQTTTYGSWITAGTHWNRRT
jgi:transcriptional regulator NrdR family protein